MPEAPSPIRKFISLFCSLTIQLMTIGWICVSPCWECFQTSIMCCFLCLKRVVEKLCALRCQQVKLFFCQTLSLNKGIRKILDCLNELHVEFVFLFFRFKELFKQVFSPLSKPQSPLYQNYIKMSDEQKKVKLQEIKETANQVLLLQQLSSKNKQKGKISLTYFVPTYLRVKLKNFTSIDLQRLEAEANVDIIITFIYGNEGSLKLPQEVANRLYDEVILNFERDPSLRLTDENDDITIKEKEEDSSITFTIRRKIHMKIESEVYITPFEKLYLILPITIQQLPATMLKKSPRTNIFGIDRNKYEATVKFNFMNRHNSMFVMLDYKKEKQFGHHSLIENQLSTQYSYQTIVQERETLKKYYVENKRKKMNEEKERIKKRVSQRRLKLQTLFNTNGYNQNHQDEQQRQVLIDAQIPRQQKKESLKNFQYSTFEVPLYKHPMASLCLIFLPLWSLALVNLGIYFQNPELDERIGSLASLMIAFIALNETIRSQIPPHPKVVFVEILVYLQIFSCLVCLLESWIENSQMCEKQQFQKNEENKPIKYEFNWSQNPFFWLSAGIMVSEIIVIAGMTLYHYRIKLPSYKLDKNQLRWYKDSKIRQLNHLLWSDLLSSLPANNKQKIMYKELIANNAEMTRIYQQKWTSKLSQLKRKLQIEQQRMIGEQGGESGVCYGRECTHHHHHYNRSLPSAHEYPEQHVQEIFNVQLGESQS